MNRLTTILLSLSVASLSSCASVSRDAGVADVQQALSSRGGSNAQWNAQPATVDDERVAGMLQGELTADQAVAIATVNNPSLQVTLAELGIARAELMQASTIANPLFGAEFRFPADPFYAYEFRLAQSLIDLIQLPRRRALGRAVFDAATMRITAEVLRLASDVRSSYYDTLAATQHVAATRVILESAKTAADLAMKQHAAGNITDLDLENEQAMYEQAKLDLARAEQQLLLDREGLIRGMGLRNGAAEWRLPDRFPQLASSEMDQQQLEQLASAQRLDLSIARREVEIAQRQVPLARLAALGEVQGDIHYQRDANGARTVGPGIDVPIPIFNNGQAARSRAEAQFLRSRHLLNALLTESSSRIRSARATVAEARARVEYYRDVLLPRRQRIVDLTKLEHNAMFAGTFQLLQAKQNEAQAQRNYIDAQRDYWTARANLDRAVNGLATDTSFTPATDQGTGKRTRITRGGK